MNVTAATMTSQTAGTAGRASAGSASRFSQAMATQGQSAQATARSKTVKTGRVMRPILVPKAAALSQAQTTTATRAPMTAAETQAVYGQGTLATIMARIRQA